jgi:enoyl-CoA hydratase
METLTLTEPVPQVALLTLNRPERLNAINLAMYDELEDVVGRLASDTTTRVVVLTGAGRGFCAGQDLKDLGADPDASELGRVQYGLAWQSRAARLVRQIHELPQPVLAAVNGAASGAGLSIALAADTRIAARSARFNAAFVRIGLSGGDLGASYFLPRIVGPTAAAEMLYTGRLVDADEAERIGLVLRVVDDGALVDEALGIATQILGNSPFGIAMTKQLLWQNLEAPSLAAAQQLENRTQILASFTEDCREAEAAFLEKRAPEFHNR